MPNIPANPIPSGLSMKHNYLRKATAIPTDFNPCDIILDTSTHSICSPLDQKYLYTYDIDTKTTDDYTYFFLVDDNNNTYVEDYLQEANELMLEIPKIEDSVYSGDPNNITQSKYYNFNNLGRQKVIYFLDDENQIIFSKILNDGNIEIFADDESKELMPSISYYNYSNIKKTSTNVNIYWDTLLSSTSNVSGTIWNIDAPSEILFNTNKVVLYDTTKYLRNYIESLEGVSR